MAELVVGVDPASTKLAFVAKHPLTPTYASAKYVLGKKYGPDVAGEAMDVTLDFLNGISTMAPSTMARLAFIEAPVVGKGGVRSTMVQAFTSGVVQACFVKAGFSVYLVQNTAWKSAMCGSGSASKDDVGRTLAARWPRLHKVCAGDQDLKDAALICLYGVEVASRGQVVAAGGRL